MEWLKNKPEVFIKKNPIKELERKKHIPLDITPSEIILKIRKKEISEREKEINNYMNNMEKINIKLINLNHSLNRVKSLTELASIRQKILTESCKF
jgi:hypothetical protein